MVCSINWTTAMTNGQRNQSDLEKQGRQDHKASVHRNGGQACSSAIPTYSCGACPTAYDSLYLTLHACVMSKIQNVGCLNAFLLPSFSTTECRHQRPSERSDNGRSQRAVFSSLHCHTILFGLSQEYGTAIKGQPNDEAVCRGVCADDEPTMIKWKSLPKWTW